MGGGVELKDKPTIYDRAVDHRMRVRYAETDRMGVVYHANYLIWFEIGRTEFCRAAGIPYRQMEEEGVLIPVTGLECKYRRPAHYDDTILIRTRMGDVGSRGLSFFYEIRNDRDELLAEGSSRHIFTNVESKPIAIPPRVRETFAAFIGASTPSA
jgi:acyl-CoA thioester hydrolase